jgi:capsular exopolysaccharide synthesis family protein
MENTEKQLNNLHEEEPLISLADIWGLIWGHKWWYVASLAFFLCVGVFYLYVTPKVYSRVAKVLIDESNQDATMRNLGVASAGMMRLRSFNSVENEIETFASPDLMQVVVERLGLQTRYVQEQLLRDVELYRNCPFDARFAGENPHSPYSFKVTPAGEEGFVLSEFRLKDEKFKEEVPGSYGDTLQTPVGKVVLYPVETDVDFNHPVKVSWTTGMSAAKAFCRNMHIALSGKESSVLVFSINDTYPSRASSILSTLIDVYNEMWINNKNRAAINTTDFINERLVVIEKELGLVEDALKQYKSKNNLTDIKAVAQSYVTESSEYATKAFEVNNQLSIAQYIKEYLNNPANSLSLIPSNLGLTSASVEAQIKEYNDIVLQRDRLLSGGGENNPMVTDLNAALASIRTAILRSIDNLIATLQLQLSKIESQEKQILARMSSNSGQELQLLSIERQQQITQELYMFLLQKREENELAALINVGNTRVIMNPNGSSNPVSPNRMMIMFVMIVLGCGAPFGFFLVRKLLDTSIKHKSDLGNLSVPFLAEIPKMGKDGFNRNECKVIVKPGSRDMMNEAFRVLRTNVDLMLGKNAGSRVIMFTSFNPGAGKTFSIMNVAASMALKKSKAIIVDLDLRKATLSQALGKEHTGVAAYLNGKIDDYRPYVDEIAPDLYHLPVGTLPPNPTELLLTDRFARMVDDLKQEYDYVFLDCPPIDIVADASLITEKADMTIFVLRSGRIDKASIPYIDELYRSGKYSHMAMILNGVEFEQKKYGYGRHGYGYGYGYGNMD